MQTKLWDKAAKASARSEVDPIRKRAKVAMTKVRVCWVQHRRPCTCQPPLARSPARSLQRHGVCMQSTVQSLRSRSCIDADSDNVDVEMKR